MNIDTIVTDLDDTLLDGEGKISDHTLSVMHECTRRGIRVIPCSGRTSSSLLPFARQLNTGVPYIGGNGSEIISGEHELLEQITLNVELGREVCRFMEAHDYYVQAYQGDSFFYSRECTASRQYKHSSGLRGVEVGVKLSEYLNFRTPKLLVINDVERIAELMPLAQKVFEGRVYFTMSKPYFLEAEPEGVSKGNALKRLAERMGDIVPERTLAFGDSLNDMSMLAFTPNSVAMGNARDELKQMAAYVCRPNTEDGLARFVEEHVLAHEA